MTIYSLDLRGMMDDEQTLKVCVGCGGRCCKSFPGSAFPEDFGKTREEILPQLVWALSTQTWVVDTYKDQRFVRPAYKGESQGFGSSCSGDECVFLRDNGCELKYENRPKECRYLKPHVVAEKFKCNTSFNKQEASVAWSRHDDLISDAEQKVKLAEKRKNWKAVERIAI